jgi:endonuclease/exonuclease/phosphatase (EEP) superfamily protein YafD
MSDHNPPAAARSSFSLFGWSYTAGILLWYGLRITFFDKLWWLALLNTLAFYLFMPLVLLLPLALWQRRWRLLLGLALPCAIFATLFGPLLLSPSKTPLAPNGATVTAMSFNLLWTNRDYQKVRSMVLAAQPDLIGFQEIRPADAPALASALADEYPYSAFHPVDDFHTVGLLSRLPIESIQPLADQPLRKGFQVIVRRGEQTLGVIVAHLAPNNMPLWPFSEFVAATQQRYAQRMAETNYLRQAVLDRTMPTLILCDCNMTDTSETYARLSTTVADSFQECGWGFGHTLTVAGIPLPVQRVDYIWHTGELRAVDAYVGQDGGSDHLPLIASFLF